MRSPASNKGRARLVRRRGTERAEPLAAAHLPTDAELPRRLRDKHAAAPAAAVVAGGQAEEHLAAAVSTSNVDQIAHFRRRCPTSTSVVATSAGNFAAVAVTVAVAVAGAATVVAPRVHLDRQCEDRQDRSAALGRLSLDP